MSDSFDCSDTQPVALTAARAELEDLLDDLGVDETRVLASIARRLQRGAEAYGELGNRVRPPRLPEEGSPRGARGRPRVPRVRVAQDGGERRGQGR